MGKLIYSTIASLDGYVEDRDGRFDWAAPDEEVHQFVNDLERGTGTYLYGRRMYETMAVWDTFGSGPDDHAVIRDYAAIWRAADKVVYSRTLRTATTSRTTIEPEFDADAVRQLTASSAKDVSIGGAELAGLAIAAGLVDECHVVVCPVVVGGGKTAFPSGRRAMLQLVSERRFANGVVHLHYRVPPQNASGHDAGGRPTSP